MQRKFLTNLAFLLLVNVLVKPFWILGIDRTVQNTVGAEEYGMYFAVFNFSFLLHILLDFGISNFNNRAVARNEGLLDKFLPDIFMVKMLLGGMYFLVTFGTAFLINFSPQQIYLLALLALNQVLVSFILYFRSNIAGLQLFKLDALLSVFDRVLMIGIMAVLLWMPFVEGFRLEWFVYAQTAAYGITFLFSFGLVLRKSMGISLTWNWRAFRKILKLSYPFALLGLLMAIYGRIDAVMIERMLPDTGRMEAGIYAASFRLLDAVNMIGFAFASILLPLFARMIKNKEPVGQLLQVSYRTLMMAAIMVVVISFVYRHEIMYWLYEDATPYWAQIFGVLIISFAGMGTVYIFGSLLTARGELRVLNWIAITGVVLNIVLNIFLIYRWAALGATVATLITELLVAAAHVITAWKIFNLRFNTILISKLFVFFLLVLAITLGAYQLPFHWLPGAGLAILLSIIVAFLLRIIDIKEWKKELEAY